MESPQEDRFRTTEPAHRLGLRSPVTVVGIVAVLATISMFAALWWRVSRTTMTAGLWYENGSLPLPRMPRRSLAGPSSGIGRGIGSVAAHEFAHQILGGVAVHDDTDENSYEYPSPDRASQYYGELHWTIAQPLLHQKIGRGA